MAQKLNQEQENTSSGHGRSSNFQGSPRPSGHVLATLPYRYIKAITRPSVKTYAQGEGQASWSIVWMQLLLWAVLDAVLGVLVNIISPPVAGSSSASQFFSLATSIGLVVLVPLLFFLIMGLLYFFARSFGGQGTFLEQCNASLNVQVPLGIGSKLLALIPVVGRILNSVLSIYGIVLQVIVLMAVHRLSRGKAIGALIAAGVVILIPVGILYAIFFVFVR